VKFLLVLVTVLVDSSEILPEFLWNFWLVLVIKFLIGFVGIFGEFSMGFLVVVGEIFVLL